MDRAGQRRDRWKRDVDGLREIGFERAILECRSGEDELAFHLLDRVVDRLAGGGAFVRRQRADRAPNVGHFTAAAEVGDARGVERAFVGCLCDGGCESLLKFVELCC